MVCIGPEPLFFWHLVVCAPYNGHRHSGALVDFPPLSTKSPEFCFSPSCSFQAARLQLSRGRRCPPNRADQRRSSRVCQREKNWGSVLSCTLFLHHKAHWEAALVTAATGSCVFAFALTENFGRIVSRPLYRGYRDGARCFVTSQYRNKEKEPEQAKGRRVYR